MISRAKSNLVWVGLLLILLPVLAVLQYRWIGEVSAAERDRLESSLRIASERFAIDFESEFSRLVNAFQLYNGFPETAVPVAERYQSWSAASTYSRLVQTIYVYKGSPTAQPEFYRVDLEGGELAPAPLPEELASLMRDPFRRGANKLSSDSMMLISPIFRIGQTFGGPRPGPGGPGRQDFRQRRPEDSSRRGNGPQGRSPRPGPGPGPGGPVEGATLIQLDRAVILNDLVPSLAEKHFSSHDESSYFIAIVAKKGEPRVIYSSRGEWTPEQLAKPDATIDLFGGPRTGRTGGRGRGPGSQGLSPASFIGEPWQLVLRHRAGSLEQAVEHVRRRNLAIAFGIIVVLAAGLITVVVSSQRAHTLGKLQMEFAAGVSHELRTPLAVIRSAAHNLRSGIVRDKEGVEEYATIVQEEARRLSEMVEEVLLYSETQSGRKKYKLEPIDVNEVIDRALTNLSPAIDLDQCELSTHIDPDLPPLKADTAALTQCLQNLLSNAYKYGRKGDKGEIDIAARKDPSKNEIRLSVEDHGPGIDDADRRQLFEAFYRGHNVGSNTPGNGLGLHLVKRIMQAQGGRVTYAPAEHGGATFTLHIPAAS